MVASKAHPRIVVVGTSCAGKSTFARAVAEASTCMRIELDALYWGPNWQPKSTEEFRRLVSEAAAVDSWVADGNYGVVRESLWSRASTVVWLNYTYRRVLWQALWRTIKRCITREPLWHGNRESVWRSFFSRKSILVWVATTYHRRQRELAELRITERFPHLTWYEFRHPRQAQEWLAQRENAS